MARADGRTLDQMRPVSLTRDYLLHPEGSVLVEFGNTKVICTATLEEKVAPWLKGQGRGWVTANDDRIKLTSEGRHFCSEVALELI